MLKMQIKTIKATTQPTTIIMFKIINMTKIKNNIMIRVNMNRIMIMNKVTTKKVKIITKIMLKPNHTKIIIITKLKIANK